MAALFSAGDFFFFCLRCSLLQFCNDRKFYKIILKLKKHNLPVIKDNGALNRDHKKFTKELAKARMVSEHAFGLLKGRWRALLKRLDDDHWRIPNTNIACCVLHNICIIRGDEFEGDVNDNSDDDDDDDDDDNGVPSQAASGVQQPVIEF